MQTLSYGYKKPETNDKGPVVFPALEDDIQQLNDHDHDGSNSKKLTSQSIASLSQTILAANWISDGGGNYHQIVAMLPGYDYDTVTMSFRDPDGTYIYPSVTKIDGATLRVDSNDASSDMVITYGV